MSDTKRDAAVKQLHLAGNSGEQVQLVCPTCQTILGTIAVLTINVAATGPYLGPGLSELYVTERSAADVATGYQVVLIPGYVNARGRHPSGIRHWYVPGRPKRTDPKELQAFVPAVVTCRKCSQEIELRPDPNVGIYARADGESREAKRAQELDEVWAPPQLKHSWRLQRATQERLQALADRRRSQVGHGPEHGEPPDAPAETAAAETATASGVDPPIE